MNTRILNKISFPIPLWPALILLAAFSVVSCARAQAPTKEDVEKVLTSIWGKAADSLQPKATLELNSVKFGTPSKATVQQVQVEGFPEGGMVTPAVVDFTVRSFYANETQAVRRVREASVYKDKFGEWAVQTGSVRGQDVTTTEPAKK